MVSGVSRSDHPANTGTGRGIDAGWDEIDWEDVIGTASARLLTTCPDRLDRLAALSLLGLLLDHADEAGRVRLPLDTLAQELEVEPERAVRLLQRLLAVEAVHSEGDAVVVAGGHPASGHPMRPSRFLANLMAVLEREYTVPAPNRVHDAATGGGVPRPRPKSTRRALVAVGVGLAVMTLATAPSGDPGASLRTVAPPAPSGRAPWATDPAQTNTPGSTVDVSGEQATGTDDRRAPGDDVAGASPAPGPVGADAGPSRPLEGTDEDGRVPRPQRQGPYPRTPSGDTPGPIPSRPVPASLPTRPAPSDRQRTCPPVVPELVVTGTSLLATGPRSVLDVIGEPVLQVTGTVANTSDEVVTIEAIEIRAGEAPDQAIGSVLTVPLFISPGGTASWEARLPAGPGIPVEPPVDARIVAWSWTDPDLADACRD